MNSCSLPVVIVSSVAFTALLLSSCVHHTQTSAASHPVLMLRAPLTVDGCLEETVYGQEPFTADFKVASMVRVKAPETRAWLWWDQDGLWFAFAARDDGIVAAPLTADEHAVDAQDRVEIFLWPEASPHYFCIEIAPDDAVHDYAARIYRRFDNAWKPVGAQFAAQRTPGGYAVEGFISVADLRLMGMKTWGIGTHLGVGLFRADFRPGAPEDPIWLTWIDPHLPQADFHVQETFAQVILAQ